MSGSKKNFRHIVFDLWVSRFVTTFDQLLEDGYCQETVLDYYANNAKDIGFVWRSSYSDHCKNIKTTTFGYQNFTYAIYNLLTVISLIFRVFITGEKLYATRPFKGTDHNLPTPNEATYIKVLTDFMHLPIRYPNKKNGDYWHARFKETILKNKIKISDRSVHLLINNSHKILPRIYMKSSGNSPITMFSSMTIINYSGDIFKSNLVFELLWNFYSGTIIGVQHGGGYDMLKSRLFEAEMMSYNSFLLMKLEKTRQQAPEFMRLSLQAEPGIILVRSMPYDLVESTREHRFQHDAAKVKCERDVLSKTLRDTGIPILVREHPKSHLINYANTLHTSPTSQKPIIWTRNEDLIILDAPGTTAELNCILYGLNYCCVFDVNDYQFTDNGAKHYAKLRSERKLLSLHEIEKHIRGIFDGAQ